MTPPEVFATTASSVSGVNGVCGSPRFAPTVSLGAPLAEDSRFREAVAPGSV